MCAFMCKYWAFSGSHSGWSVQCCYFFFIFFSKEGKGEVSDRPELILKKNAYILMWFNCIVLMLKSCLFIILCYVR